MAARPIQYTLLFCLALVASLSPAACGRGGEAAGGAPVGSNEAPLQCGCPDTGDYEPPETVAPRTAPAQNDLFRIAAPAPGPGQAVQQVTVHRNSDDAIVYDVQIPNNNVGPSIGFDPTGTRLVYSFTNARTAPTQRTLAVVDLTAAAPAAAERAFPIAGVAFDLSFNPRGTHLAFATTASTAPPRLTLTVADLREGPALFTKPFVDDSLVASLPPDPSLDTPGDATWGFSRKEDEALAYAYRTTATSPVSWSMVNLALVKATQGAQGKRSRDLRAGASWAFSPCGDTLGLISPSGVGKAAEIFSTNDVQSQGGTNSATAVFSFRTAPPAPPTPSKHQILSNGTPSVAINNAAALACPPSAFPSALLVDADSVVGGSLPPLSGTLLLSGPAPAGGLQVKLGTQFVRPPEVPPSNFVASVPAVVTVPAGETSVRFPVQTAQVPVPVDVTLRASLGTVTQGALLRVLPAPPRAVASLTFNPTSVAGGSSLTGQIALAGLDGDTAVTLQLDNTLVATPSQTTFLVPGGVQGVQFNVATQPVLVTTTVTGTASSAVGPPATATFDVSPDVQAPELLPCAGQTLAPNDDESSPPFALPFTLNFFGTQIQSIFVNNNGNITSAQAMSTFTPFAITENTQGQGPIIAPFFADVDTSVAPSNVVAYGQTDFQGRPAVCVSWGDVGYFNQKTDKLNSFQLLLVDRSTGAPGASPGDFDIVMNYNKIDWETGEASGGVGGLGGTSAGGGYSPGSGVPGQFFEFPGSRVPGSLLDTNPATGLVNTRRNSLVLGRHVFEVRNGAAPIGATVSGAVTQNGAQPLGDAPVQVCRVDTGRCVFFTLSASDGHYAATALPPGEYVVSAYPPAGSSLLPATSPPIQLGAANVVVNLNLVGPVAVPPGTSIGPNHGAPGGVPVVNWHDALTLRTKGCEGGLATFALVLGATTLASGPMAEAPPPDSLPGTFGATIPPLFPQHGQATINIAIDCPDGKPDESISFSIYIDPSGTVVTPSGDPVPDAIVSLLRSDSPAGPFEPVPDGSAIMSPTNRKNPDRSDARGHYGWDVIAGFYVVRAQREGCTALDGAPFVESPVLTIPPPVTDLDLVLDCPSVDLTPPAVNVALSTPPNGNGFHNGPVDVALNANDVNFGVAGVFFELSGAESGSGFVSGAEVTLSVRAEGDTTVTYWAIDAAGNEAPRQTLVIRINTSVPSITCAATPSILWSNDHRLVNVKAKVVVGDGATSFKLVSVTSNEPDLGPDFDDRPNDIQGFDFGTPDLAGRLRDERLRQGNGREYTLLYEAANAAGNTAQCATHVLVPR